MPTPTPHHEALLDELSRALWTVLETGLAAADRDDPIAVADCMRASWMLEAVRRELRSGADDERVAMLLRGNARFARDRAWRGTEEVGRLLDALPDTWRALRRRHAERADD